MRTANNNSNFTVEALVAKYRNYVNEHCPKTIACAPTGESVEIPNTYGYMESLLLALYISAAGDKVNKNVVNALAGYSHLYQDYYKDAAFTSVYPGAVDLKQVVNTNKCLLSLESHEGMLLVTSVIDNLLKGASGAAVQNMNLCFGLPEKTGLKLKASAF